MFLIHIRLKKFDTLLSTVKYVPDWEVDRWSFVFHSVLDQYKTQKVCEKIVFADPFNLKHCQDRYTLKKFAINGW